MHAVIWCGKKHPGLLGYCQLLSAAVIAAFASPALADDLAVLLQSSREKHQVPAMAAAVVSHDQVLHVAAVGVRRSGGEEQVTIEDAFHLGSCTKAMTATLAALLINDGVLTWTTTIGEVFDDLPMHESWKSVTIEQLLHNRGGVPGDLRAGGLWQRLWMFDGSPREARMELVRGVLKGEALPVGKFEYSNGGFAIAGAMLERLTDTSWEELMDQRLFKPLGMSTAGFGAPGRPGEITQPRGHRGPNMPVEPGPGADNPPAINPANAVHCSITDWAKFIMLHMQRSDDGQTLLSREQWSRMHVPAPDVDNVASYAMGWIVTDQPWAKGDAEDSRGRILTHAGSNTLWYAEVWIAMDRDRAVLVVSNGGSAAEEACREVISQMQRRYIVEPAGGE